MARKRGAGTTPAPLAHPDPSDRKPPSSVMETRVFKSGNSYAVRLPKSLYSGGETPVYLRKLDDGRLLITPKLRRRWPAGFLESFGSLPDDFEAPARPAGRAADQRRAKELFRDPE